MSRWLEIQTETGWGETLRRFASWCRPQPGWWTLDVGCGPGLLPALFAGQGCRAFGVDLLVEMPLSPNLAQADAYFLPFSSKSFHLVTASNLLFLLESPLLALHEMRRVLRADGQLCLLNPSERMSQEAALSLAVQHGLNGLERESLLDWAQRAEAGPRWDEPALARLLREVGMQLVETTLWIGPGLARLCRAQIETASEA